MQLYRFNNRKWFGIAVGVLIAGTLLFSFALIFNVVPHNNSLNFLWEILRYGLAVLVLLSWGILNVTPPRPSGFVVAFAELGQERVEDGAIEGLIRQERRRLNNLLHRGADSDYDEEAASIPNSRYLNELRRNRNASPSGELPEGKSARALPGGRERLATNTAMVLADRSRNRNSADGGFNGSDPGGRSAAALFRRQGEAFLNEFGEDEKRPTSKVKFQPPESFFAWETAVGARNLSDYLQADVLTELSDASVKGGVNLYSLVFTKNRDNALREADVPGADAVIWGWQVYRKRRDFVPVFELRQPMEKNRPARGGMEILGLKSFDLGLQTARQSTIFSAFVAGFGAYGFAGEAPTKEDEQVYYHKARSEFRLSLAASYMYEDRTHYQSSVDRGITYFFMGNTCYYLNELDKAVYAYREALVVEPNMIEARHNMGVIFFLQGKFDFALKSLIKVIQLRPNMAIARLNLGIAYLAQKQFTAARREFQNAIKLDGKFAGAYRAIGVSYREEGDYPKALQYLEEALRTSPQGKYAEARVDIALVQAQQARADNITEQQANQHYRVALEQLQQAIVENPNLPEAHYQLARLLYDGGQEDEAGLALLEAVRLQPNYSDALHLLAEIYEKRGRLDLRDKYLELMMKARQASSATTAKELIQRGIGARLIKDYTLAREELGKALKMEPRNTEALYELGVLYQEMDEPVQALNTFQTVLKLPAPPVEVYNRISNLRFQQDDRQGAMDILRQAVAADPTNAKLQYYLGNAFRKQKIDEKAIESYIRAIQLEPDMAEPHFNLGMIYLTRRQINDAILQFREVVRIRPEDYETYLFLGRAYRQSNQIEQAVTAIQEAISLKSDLLEARLLLGEIYLRQAEPERAIEQLTVVQTYNPKDLRARELIGKGYAQAGQLERAIETFQDIIVEAPDSVSAHYNLGVSYISQKRYKEAIYQFAEVTRYKSDDADAFFNMGVAIHELLNGPEQNSLEAAELDQYFNEEVRVFRQAIKLRPTNPEPYRYLGQLYTRINNIEEAMRYLNEYGRLKKQG